MEDLITWTVPTLEPESGRGLSLTHRWAEVHEHVYLQFLQVMWV